MARESVSSFQGGFAPPRRMSAVGGTLAIPPGPLKELQIECNTPLHAVRHTVTRHPIVHVGTEQDASTTARPVTDKARRVTQRTLTPLS